MRILLFALLASCIYAQEGPTYDFSGAGKVIPWRIRPDEPGRCVVNEVYKNGTTGVVRVCTGNNQWADLSTIIGALSGNGDMVAATYITSGTGAPVDPCPTRGAQYWDNSTSPKNGYLCPADGGGWLGPVSFGAGGGGGTWGSITGTLSAQSDLNTALGLKVPTSTTVNGHALSGNVTVSNSDLGAVPTTTTVNGHALSGNVSVTASDVGLGSVTNAAQTQAAVVPNTAPSAGQVLAGNAGGTAYAPVTVSGDGTMASTGALTVTKLNNVSVAQAATASTIVQRNSSGEVIAANTVATGKTALATDGSAAALTSFPTLNQNTSGTAANLSGTPALPNGTAATTQTVGDSTTKIATTAFVAGAVSAAGGGNVSNSGSPTTGALTKWASSTTLADANLSGDATTSGTTAVTVTKVNGTSLAGLATGILKNTTTTGVPSIAIAADFPTLNQNTTGTAANLSGTPAIPNGTTATTQSAADNTTKLATTAYADAAAAATRPNVTNNTQTQAAVVPNTAPSAGQLLVGNAGGTAYAPVSASGDATVASTGAVTVAKVNGITISGTPSTGYVPTATGSTAATWQAAAAGSGITTSCGTTTYTAGGTTTIDWTSSNCTKITASSGNTTLALSNPHGVGPYYITLCNDGTARTWTLPGTLLQASVPSIASECVKAAYTYDGTNYSGDGSDETPSTMRLDSERSAPATPAANKSVGWLDSTNHDLEFKFNNSANIYRLVLQGIDITTSTGRVTGINGTAISGTSGNVWTYGASNTAADAGFLATNVVRKDAANTWATGAQDFGSATSLKVPVGAGATTATNGFVAYDSTNNMLHAAQSGADAKVPQFTVTPTNAHCVTWVVSGSNYKLGDTACASGGGGGVNAQTANYTLVSGDSGMLVTMDCSSCTATLPASPPSSTWTAWIQNLNASALTVGRNGLTINTGTSNITLQQYQWTIVYTNGTNYFAKPPTTAGANITLTMSAAAETIIGAAATGCAVGGAAGDLQMNDGAGGCSASHLNDNGTTIKTSKELDLVANPETVEVSNESGTGTTVNKIAKATGAPMTAIIATTADTTGEAIGIVVGGAGTTSSARIARNGIASCVFDGATTADHYVTVSSTVTGDCHDFGATPPQDGSTIIGRVQSTNGSGGTYAVLLRPPTNGNGPNPMTAAGQFIYGGTSGAPTALASGTGFLYANATSAPTIGKLARGIAFAIGDPAGSALTAASTTTDYITVPFACTISAYNLLVDAGTITVKFWKVATGTAIPTSGNSISTSGVAISSGTAIHSATVSDFTSTTVTANDIMAMNVTAVATAKYVQGTLQCDQ